MHSVEDAIQHLLKPLSLLAGESIAIQNAFGRILATDVVAQHDLPPFANSGMDGYALIHADLSHLPTTLTIIEDIPAGNAPTKTVKRGQAARIMTGAPLPSGADTVVPVELTGADRHHTALPDMVVIQQAVKLGSNIRHAGEDVMLGEVVLQAGRRLRAADIGVLAGLGYHHVEVRKRPKIVVLSTGNELLTPDQPLSAGKIRDMNGYTLPAMIAAFGGEAISLGIVQDTVDDVRKKFNQAIDHQPDIIVSSAGVSVGAFDVVKSTLEELGHLQFWKVNMRPGKPLTVGDIGGVPFLGLPGNPVSAMVTFMVFVRPMITKLLGQDPAMHTTTVFAGESMESDGRMTFARVRLVREDGKQIAYSTGTQSSGAISSLVKADALLIIPENVKHISVGQPVEVWPLDF